MLIIGDGPKMSTLSQKAVKMQIAEKIIFMGSRSDVNKILQAVDILLLPSLHEGLGFVVIEAQYASLQSYISENVPRECIISDKVKQIKLDLGAKYWAQIILNSKIKRKKIKFKCNNYDIQIQSKCLENEYIRLFEEKSAELEALI